MIKSLGDKSLPTWPRLAFSLILQIVLQPRDPFTLCTRPLNLNRGRHGPGGEQRSHPGGPGPTASPPQPRIAATASPSLRHLLKQVVEQHMLPCCSLPDASTVHLLGAQGPSCGRMSHLNHSRAQGSRGGVRPGHGDARAEGQVQTHCCQSPGVSGRLYFGWTSAPGPEETQKPLPPCCPAAQSLLGVGGDPQTSPPPVQHLPCFCPGPTSPSAQPLPPGLSCSEFEDAQVSACSSVR